MSKRIWMAAVMALLTTTAMGWAQTAIDFEAQALRPANSDSSDYPVATELPSGNGMYAETDLSGQKSMYGTKFFNGTALSDISKLEYSYYTYEWNDAQDKWQAASAAYSNFAVKGRTTDGDFYGILSGSKAASYANVDYNDLPSMVKDVVDNTVSDSYTIKAKRATIDVGTATILDFYEPSDSYAPAHWGDAPLADFDFELTGNRPMSISGDSNWTGGYYTKDWTGESGFNGGVWRGPYEHGISVLWGDSANNYLGNAYVWDVKVTLTNGDEFVAGVPAPAAVFAGMGLLGALGLRRRR